MQSRFPTLLMTTVAVLLLMQMAAAQMVMQPQPFSADMQFIPTRGGGMARDNGKMYFGSGHMRMDMQGGQHGGTVIITDFKTQTTDILMPEQHMYMEHKTGEMTGHRPGMMPNIKPLVIPAILAPTRKGRPARRSASNSQRPHLRPLADHRQGRKSIQCLDRPETAFPNQDRGRRVDLGAKQHPGRRARRQPVPDSFRLYQDGHGQHDADGPSTGTVAGPRLCAGGQKAMSEGQDGSPALGPGSLRNRDGHVVVSGFPHPLERCRSRHPIYQQAKAEYARLH